jgi:hypothetical protein
VLAGLANIRTRRVTEAVDGVAAAAIGLQKCDIDTFRRRLIILAVERSVGQRAPAELRSPAPPAPHPPADGSFAARVKQLAEKLTTPPFQGRVAIAQVYDAYGRIHPDAGSLQSFKARLVEAAKARALVWSYQRRDASYLIDSTGSRSKSCASIIIDAQRSDI